MKSLSQIGDWLVSISNWNAIAFKGQKLENEEWIDILLEENVFTKEHWKLLHKITDQILVIIQTLGLSFCIIMFTWKNNERGFGMGIS